VEKVLPGVSHTTTAYQIMEERALAMCRRAQHQMLEYCDAEYSSFVSDINN
jgi:hypothetical protein